MTPCRYTFSEPSPDWVAAFAAEAELLQQLLQDLLVDIHHIGSTSIPGMTAKPIIDLPPVVQDASLMDALTAPLESAGYEGRGELGLAGRRFFLKNLDGWRTHNLHFYPAGHPDIERHLAFCAYLRSHHEDAREYEQLKRAAFRQHPDDVIAYNEFKNSWVKRLEPIALRWWQDERDSVSDSFPSGATIH